MNFTILRNISIIQNFYGTIKLIVHTRFRLVILLARIDADYTVSYASYKGKHSFVSHQPTVSARDFVFLYRLSRVHHII